MVDITPSLPQVVIRVVPRLLADALRIVLTGRRLQVSNVPTTDRRRAPRTPRSFDLAIVTEELPDDVRATHVIHVDADGTPNAVAGAPVRVPSPHRDALAGLLALIDDLLR